MSRFALFVATAGYVGYFPIAPGTVGSLAGLAIFAALRWSGQPLAEIAAIVVTLVGGAWAAGAAERELARKDPGPVVIDEVLGMLITLAWIPVTPAGALAGFLLFRVFDIVKPFPAGRFERIPGGWGVMLDDAMAGVYAHLALRGLVAAFPGVFA